jgi:hypothetical protein
MEAPAHGRLPYSVRDAAKSLKIGKSTAAKDGHKRL